MRELSFEKGIANCSSCYCGSRFGFNQVGVQSMKVKGMVEGSHPVVTAVQQVPGAQVRSARVHHWFAHGRFLASVNFRLGIGIAVVQ